MSKRVAIMTWYTYHNYGTVLQASALYNKIRELGYSPDIINYLPRGGSELKTPSVLVSEIKNKTKSIIKRNYNSQERIDLFLDYLNSHITETQPCNSYPELNDLSAKYDAFVCGSDQIWSPLNFDEKYFLSFVKDDSKKIAYAPSLGTSKIENSIVKERMSKLIKKFKHLSVREVAGKELINSISSRKAEIVLDPTLLMKCNEWDEYADVSASKKIEGEYIICYFLGDPDRYKSYVRSLSKQMNIPYYVIPVKKKEKKSAEVVPFEVGPREFLNLIKNAKYVCTDSFHGIAFAVNYNIPFSVFKRFQDDDPRNQNSRIFSLLELLSLENRLVSPQEKISEEIFYCDFSKSNNLLKDLRDKSLEYLKKSLEEASTPIASTISLFDGKITDLCCGCGACASICKKSAITVSMNEEGFQHYSIDATKCIHCGMCKTVCPMTNIESNELKYSQGLYAVKSNSIQVLKKSSSGGVAHELSKAFQKNGMYVCGCYYDSELNVAKHIIIKPDQTEKLHILQGSKYIQSITADIIKEIPDVTKQHKMIFFGTPCQCAAVDKLCRKYHTRDNLYIVDLICHGVPSYYLWKKYLHDMNLKYSIGDHPTALFRSNKGKWNLRTLTLEGNNVVHDEKEDRDDFYAFFRRGLCDMRSCSDCPYREKSSADLRIGDYWGHKFKKDINGVSMVIAINDKGNELMSILRNNGICDAVNYPLEEYWKIQAPYNHIPSLAREEIIEKLKGDKENIHQLRKKYCKYYDVREKISSVFQYAIGIIKH